MEDVLRIREDEPPSVDEPETTAEGPGSPEAQVAESSVRRLVLVRRERWLAGASQEPGQIARKTPFKRYALATHGVLQPPGFPAPPGDAAA